MLMVQSNAQVPMKTSKIKGPPPIPPRPNQSVVAEALAKTRKAVAESKANLTKPRTIIESQKNNKSKAKTLERLNSGQSASETPKQTGLARVKSFIRDVISDRSSSSDEKKSSGHNSRRSSSDSSSSPSTISTKKSNESLNSKAVKTCRQILVRSLSTSNKLEQDGKCKVIKSSSFADKSLPLRKAPPPPLSPKPKLRPMKTLPVNRQSLERVDKLAKPELSLYSSPIDARKPPHSPISEAPYATVQEVQDYDERLRDNPEKKTPASNITNGNNNNSVTTPTEEQAKFNSLERKTSRVTDMLISEILASRNKNDANAVIDKGKDDLINDNIGDVSPEIRKDMNNHEMLIYELQTMRSQSNVPEILDELNSVGNVEEDVMSTSAPECSDECPSPALSIATQEGSDYANTYACIIDDDLKSRLRKQFRAISSMSLQGLPPLPRSLSGFSEEEDVGQEHPNSSPVTPEVAKPPTDLDSQLAYLKREMASLRQLDLSLLSELWALSEAMSSWRRQLERGLRLRPAPPPPLPPHYLRT